MAMYRVTLNMSLNYKKTPYNHNLSPGGFAPLKKLPAFAQVFSQQAVPAPYPVLAQGPVIFAGLLKQAPETAVADAACLHIHQHLWKILYTKALHGQGPQQPVVIGSDAKGGIKIPNLLQQVPREINAWMRRHPTVAQTFGLKNATFPQTKNTQWLKRSNILQVAIKQIPGRFFITAEHPAEYLLMGKTVAGMQKAQQRAPGHFQALVQRIVDALIGFTNISMNHVIVSLQQLHRAIVRPAIYHNVLQFRTVLGRYRTYGGFQLLAGPVADGD